MKSRRWVGAFVFACIFEVLYISSESGHWSSLTKFSIGIPTALELLFLFMLVITISEFRKLRKAKKRLVCWEKIKKRATAVEPDAWTKKELCGKWNELENIYKKETELNNKQIQLAKRKAELIEEREEKWIWTGHIVG